MNNLKIKLKEIFKNSKFNVEEKNLPIKRWKQERDIISSIKLERRYVTIRTHEKRKKITKNSLLLNFKKFGWVRIASEWKYFRIISPERFIIKNGYVNLKLKNEIGAWYKSGDHQVRYLVLPKTLKANKGLFELIGILEGEMTEKKSSTGGTTFRVTNSEMKILRKIVTISKIFGIYPKNWKVSLTLNSKNKTFGKKELIKLKEKWSNNLGIPVENFGKITITKKYKSKFSPYGIVQLRYSNQQFWYFIKRLIEFSHKIILTNKTCAIHYLRGLIAGEGGVGLSKSKKIRFVQIGVTKSKNRKFYLRVLKFLKIKNYKVYSEKIEIYSLKNFKLLNSWKVFQLNPPRNLIFQKSFNNLKLHYGVRLT